MARNMEYKYPLLQELIYPLPHGGEGGVLSPVETTFKDALLNAINVTGRSLMSVAEAAGVSYDKLKNLRQGKSQTTNVDDAVKVAAAFGVSLEDFYDGNFSGVGRQLSIAGRVGAGAIVHLVDDHAKGDGLYHIECPSIISPHGIVGVEVEGDSMAPYYHPSDVLLYSRDTVGVPTEAIGRICVCEDTDGRAWVKTVRIGSEEGTFSLISVNPSAENRHGVRLKWAAPVRLHLPYELVKKV